MPQRDKGTFQVLVRDVVPIAAQCIQRVLERFDLPGKQWRQLFLERLVVVCEMGLLDVCPLPFMLQFGSCLVQFLIEMHASFLGLREKSRETLGFGSGDLTCIALATEFGLGSVESALECCRNCGQRIYVWAFGQ